MDNRVYMKMETAKDYIMLWQWRFMSIQGFIAPLFYISTMSLLIYPYVFTFLQQPVAEFLWTVDLDKNYLGLTIMLMVYGSMALLMMTVAYLWDKKAEMWKSAHRTSVRRSQFSGQDALTIKEQLNLKRMWIPLMKKLEIDTNEVEAWIREKGLEDESKNK
tara:strand:- start:313 stop:795 length:483 start_codon:yes stop_codon:yes gene_type:complete